MISDFAKDMHIFLLSLIHMDSCTLYDTRFPYLWFSLFASLNDFKVFPMQLDGSRWDNNMFACMDGYI